MFGRKKVSEKAFNVLMTYVDDIQKDFLEVENNYLYKQLDGKTGKQLCELCSCKHACGNGLFPDCLSKIL